MLQSDKSINFDFSTFVSLMRGFKHSTITCYNFSIVKLKKEKLCKIFILCVDNVRIVRPLPKYNANTQDKTW